MDNSDVLRKELTGCLKTTHEKSIHRMTCRFFLMSLVRAVLAVLKSSDIFKSTCFYGLFCSAQPAASRPGYLASATSLRCYLDLGADPLLQGWYV